MLRADFLYENWGKEIIIWQRVPTLEQKKEKTLAIFLSLEGKAKEAALDIDVESLNKEDSVGKVLAQLDKVHLKYKIQLVYQAYDTFEKFERLLEMSVAAFLIEFECFHNKDKACNMVLPNEN